MQYNMYAIAIALALLASSAFASRPDFDAISENYMIASSAEDKKAVLVKDNFLTDDHANQIQTTLKKLNTSADVAAALKDFYYESTAKAILASNYEEFLEQAQIEKIKKYEEEIATKFIDHADLKIFLETGDLPEISAAETERVAAILKIASDDFLSSSPDFVKLASPKEIEFIKVMEDLNKLEGKSKLDENDYRFLFKLKGEQIDLLINSLKQKLTTELNKLDVLSKKINDSMTDDQKFNDIDDSTVRGLNLSPMLLSALKSKNPAKDGSILEILQNPADFQSDAAIQIDAKHTDLGPGTINDEVPLYKSYWFMFIAGIIALLAICGGCAYMIKANKTGLVIKQVKDHV